MDVSWTVIGIFPWESVWMRLNAVRIKYLHNSAEIDTLDKIVDIWIPNIVAEHEKRLFDAFRLGEGNYQMTQIYQPGMHLDNDHRSVRRQGPERLFVVHLLFGIEPLDLPANFADVQGVGLGPVRCIF